MELKNFIVKVAFMGTIACAVPAIAASCSNNGQQKEDNTQIETAKKGKKKVGGPQLGSPGGGPVIDKTDDAVLQAMIKSVVPKFKQLEYTDSETGKVLKYNLYVPQNAEPGKKYPLVLFMADASTPGTDYTTPITQGYGALV